MAAEVDQLLFLQPVQVAGGFCPRCELQGGPALRFCAELSHQCA